MQDAWPGQARLKGLSCCRLKHQDLQRPLEATSATGHGFLRFQGETVQVSFNKHWKSDEGFLRFHLGFLSLYLMLIFWKFRFLGISQTLLH